MKRVVLLLVLLVTMGILATSASADVRTSGPGPLRTDSSLTAY